MLFKELSFGIEASSSFGNVENSVANQRIDVSLATKYNETTKIRGGSVTLGTQFNKEFKNKTTITAGAAVKLGNDLRVTGNEYLYSLTFSGTGGEAPRDTISQSVINGKSIPPVFCSRIPSNIATYLFFIVRLIN